MTEYMQCDVCGVYGPHEIGPDGRAICLNCELQLLQSEELRADQLRKKWVHNHEGNKRFRKDEEQF